jgi:hypothetical protein
MGEYTTPNGSGTTIFVPSPIPLPEPVDPIKELLFPDYSAMEERRAMEAEARQFMQDYFSGKVIGQKLDLMLLDRLVHTALAWKAWLEYLITLESGPARISGSATPTKPAKVTYTPSPEMMMTGLRGFLLSLASDTRSLVRDAEKVRDVCRAVTKGHSKDIQRLDKAIRDAGALIERVQELLHKVDLESQVKDFEAMIRELQKAIANAEQLVEEKTQEVLSSSTRVTRTLPPGVVHLVGDLYAEIDPATVAELRNGYGDDVATLFQGALGHGFTARLGAGESGIKMTSPYELKVRRDNLEASGAPGVLRLYGTVQVRVINSSSVRVIVFNRIGRGH